MKPRISRVQSSTRQRNYPQRLEVENLGSGWVVKREGNTKATSVHATQAEAIDAARKRLRLGGGALAIRRSDGRISESFTLGRKAMAKISAIEGINLSPKVRAGIRALDREDLSPGERRERILRTYGKSKATKG